MLRIDHIHVVSYIIDFYNQCLFCLCIICKKIFSILFSELPLTHSASLIFELACTACVSSLGYRTLPAGLAQTIHYPTFHPLIQTS